MQVEETPRQQHLRHFSLPLFPSKFRLRLPQLDIYQVLDFLTWAAWRLVHERAQME
jgi:hypothetical protein